jgi:hypothetical protein
MTGFLCSLFHLVTALFIFQLFRHSILSALIVAVSMTAAVAAERVDVGLFSAGNTDGWQQKIFSGQTDYSLTTADNLTRLKAHSDHSASAYYKKIKVDLNKTPVLNWSWRKLKTLRPGDENEKSGDDFVARIYVIKHGGLFFWNTLAINYVWSYQHKKTQVWDNPFAGNRAKMQSQRDADDAEALWFYEKRNIAKDFFGLHGVKINQIDGVAIMTDSDNSGASAEAEYGDIYFSEN